MFRSIWLSIRATEAAPPWGLGAALAALLAAAAAMILGAALASIFVPDQSYTLVVGWTITTALMAMFVFIYLSQPKQRAALRFDSQSPLPNTFFLLLIGVGLAVTLDVLLRGVTGTFWPELELMRLYTDFLLYQRSIPPLGWVFAVVLMVIFQPLGEELVFRGVLLPALRARLGPWPGYLLTSLLYALFHLIFYATDPNSVLVWWYGLVYPFVAGLIFGAVRLNTGSTRAAFIVHAAFGLFAVIKLVTLVSG